MDENEVTLQECTRIQKLTLAVDELVAWRFIMDEKEKILTDLEKLVDIAEEELNMAEKSLEFQCRRCALLPTSSYKINKKEKEEIKISEKSRPCAASGEDRELSKLWESQGNAFIQQYKRHTERYKRVWGELLEEPDIIIQNNENFKKNSEKEEENETNPSVPLLPKK